MNPLPGNPDQSVGGHTRVAAIVGGPAIRETVEAAKAGDLTAFGQLVERFQNMAYGVAYAMLGDFHSAQDVTQEAMITA